VKSAAKITCGDDCRARTDLLAVETDLAFVLGHRRERVGGRSRGFGFIAEELHIAAERNGRDLPARAVTVVEAEKFRPEAERECEDLHAGPAGDEKVTEFVEENDEGEDEQKRNCVADESMTQRIETIRQKFH
jgi:hypothetical protein